MATNYPSGADSFVNPAGTSLETNPDHAGQHTNINDAMAAMQTTVGTTAGTNVLKAFAAGNIPIRQNTSNVVLDSLAAGTIGTFTGNTGTIGTFNAGTIGSVIAGTYLTVNSIPGSALSTNSNFLGYGTATTLGTVGVGTTILCSGTVTVPSGGRRVKLTGWIPQTYSVAGESRADLRLLEGGTEISTAYALAPVSTGGIGGMTVMGFLTPSAGAHTYSLGLSRGNGTSVVTAYADSVNFIKLIVELV